MIKIMPSILGQENKIDIVNKCIKLGIDTIHYDVMDGVFVDNTSLPISEIKEIVENTAKHNISLHLMVKEPARYMNKIKDINYETVSFHFDSTSREQVGRILDMRHKGIGLAINPNTELEEFKEFLPKLSHLVIMTVQAGYGGQKFMTGMIDKIREINVLIEEQDLDCEIFVDGGVNADTIKLLKNENVARAVVGSYLMNNLNQDTIDVLEK